MPAGTHSLTAVAFDNDGANTTSTAVSITVFFNNLAPGTYVAAVAAIGSGGTSTSTGVTFAR